MNITFDIVDEDIVKEVHIDCSPTEWLEINMALKTISAEPDCLEDDKKIIQEMLKVMPTERRIGG